MCRHVQCCVNTDLFVVCVCHFFKLAFLFCVFEKWYSLLGKDNSLAFKGDMKAYVLLPFKQNYV